MLYKVKKYILVFSCLFFFLSYAQEENHTAIDTKRTFEKPLVEKYNSEEFIYIEPDAPKPIKEKDNSDFSWLENLMEFIGNALPYVVLILVIGIIIKIILDREGFTVFSRSPKKIIEKLDLVDEELIENTDIDSLLKQALQNNEYRLAVRYYFLTVLKQLDHKKQIKLDKDKTNSDYLFEISKQENRKQFSYLSYIYDYVWYGEFKLEKEEFLQIENAFINFKKDL